MGLDTTHNAWHGSYGAFARWRRHLAWVVGFPPLDLMSGFQDYKTPDDEVLSWDILKPDDLILLLHHSDCDGEFSFDESERIANRLNELLNNDRFSEEEWGDKTKQFIKGLQLAAKRKEKVTFH